MNNKRLHRALVLLLVLFLFGPFIVACSGGIKLGQDWRTADRSSTGIAPLAHETPEAVVLVYAARAFNWRGIFAVHTWIATKEKAALHYQVHQVVGWRAWDNLPVVESREDLPDRSWYGYTPDVLLDIRGEKAQALIPEIYREVGNYRYQDKYTLWPGPNSNTFVAEIGRRIPALNLDMPSTAIGKDYLVQRKFIDLAPSGSGYQLSLFGLLGLTLAKTEGFEFNILTFSFGISPLEGKIKLPGLGTIGG